VARAGGVPTRFLGVAFLLLLGMAVAATAEITGALLVFALLVTPAATAQLLTARPALGLALSVALAFVVTWLGLGIAYFSPYPVGFWVTSLSFGLYVLVRFGTELGGRPRRVSARRDQASGAEGVVA
jgi:zinc/manganese transport system permease protein